MTDRITALRSLLEKVEADAFTPEPGGEIMPCYRSFIDLSRTALPKNVRNVDDLAHQAYKGSLDAAKALHEAVLSERSFAEFHWSKRYEEESRVTVHLDGDGWFAASSTPARAWLIAILRALISMEEEG